MRIVWDEPKRQANLAKHGMEFAELGSGFFESAVLRPSHSERLIGIGRHGDETVVAVAFRPLGSEAVSIISMRPASQSERRLYDEG